MLIEKILNAQSLFELLEYINEFCVDSYMREDDNECYELKDKLEEETNNDYLILLSSYLSICENGEEIIEALYEFVGNCKGFVEAEKDTTTEIQKAEVEAILDECEGKCGVKSCIEYSHRLNIIQIDAYNHFKEFSIRHKGNDINLILARVDIECDKKKYIAHEIGKILFDVLQEKFGTEFLKQEMQRYIPETRAEDTVVREYFSQYFYDVVQFKMRKPGIYKEFDDYMRRVIVVEFFKRMVIEYFKE